MFWLSAYLGKKKKGIFGCSSMFLRLGEPSSPRRRCKSSHGRLVLCLGLGEAHLSVGVRLGVGMLALANLGTTKEDFLVRLGEAFSPRRKWARPKRANDCLRLISLIFGSHRNPFYISPNECPKTLITYPGFSRF